MTRRATPLLGLLLAACGEASPPTPTPAASPADAPAAVDAPDAPAQQDDLCKAFDRDRVAAALGWQGLAKVSGVSTRGNGVANRTCTYVDKARATGTHFGVLFTTGLEFDARDVGHELDYGPHDPVAGAEARIARGPDKVLLQLVRGDLRLRLSHSGGETKAAELEPKLLAAATELLATLPPSAAGQLARK